MIALDCETTGVDLRHGALPFLVTTCDAEGRQRFWEWDVDPLTRRPQPPAEDLRAVRFLVENRLSDRLVLQNGKFDCQALGALLPGLEWPWADCEDTLLAGHLLHSGQPHDLTSMAVQYLGLDIQPFEDRLERACQEGRRLARSRLPAWRIAREGLPEMPSAKGQDKKERGGESERPWKFDCWLPRALARELDYRRPGGICKHQWGEDWLCRRCRGHRWWVLAAEYANADSASTVRLWAAMESELRRRGLWEIYREQVRLAEVVKEMEACGVTYSVSRRDELRDDFRRRSLEARAECLTIAESLGFALEMPKGASPNGSLRKFCFDVLRLEPVANPKAKSEAPTLNKDVMRYYLTVLDKGTVARRFLDALVTGRQHDTILGYLDNYDRYAVPVERWPGFLRLHPAANQTGTDTLRFSMSNPNGQNIPKNDPDEDEEGGRGWTVRRLFGPAPGREWWSMDYENIELRLPAYESGEPSMVELFERPDEPPFFGSYHLLNASIIYPDLFWPLAEQEGAFKKTYKATWYQWVKNFGFALQYRCGEATGDRAARKRGAWAAVKKGLPLMEALNDKWVAFANRHGYVETIPDRSVCAERGYPVECSRSERGDISPTLPLNYHIQSTAMQCTRRAMVRCAELLRAWSARAEPHFIALQVHDELVFDLPAGGRRNLPKVRALRAAMEESGSDIGIPLKVSVSWHPNNWQDAEEIGR